jgi:acetoin utilization protein AcuB
MLLTECIGICLDTSCPVFTDDAIAVDVLDRMMEAGYECAPVLHEGKIVAMATIANLLQVRGLKKTNNVCIRELKLEKSESIGLNEHLFDIFSRARNFSTPLISVLTEEGMYAGVLEKRRLLERVAEIFHFGEQAVTLELDVPSVDLKLSEVIATLEKNDATVLSFGSYPAVPEAESMVVAFRLQTHDLFRLVKNLEKYGYVIHYASPFFKEKDDEMREKALEFIHFMDM